MNETPDARCDRDHLPPNIAYPLMVIFCLSLWWLVAWLLLAIFRS
jgi:hypothetical protein